MSVYGRVKVQESHEEGEDTPAYLTISKFEGEILLHVEGLDYMDHSVVSITPENAKEFAVKLLKLV
jgi:hypothetical protein